MKKIVVIFLFLISFSSLFAQEQKEVKSERPNHNINLNLFGEGSIISLDYDQLFLVDKNFILSGKIGIGYNSEFEICVWGPCNQQRDQYLTIPHHLTANFGGKRHFVELGAGGTYYSGYGKQPYLVYPILAYRFLPLRANNLNFRLCISFPVNSLEDIDVLFLPIGLNLGFSF